MEIVIRNEWHLDLVCKCCQSVLKIWSRDVCCQEFHNEDRGYWHEYFVECPVCQEYLLIKGTELPKSIQASAWKKVKRNY